jgi:N-acetylglucosaminyl-diphospho-decaprenol L-rhamnosyltransferase
MSARVDVILVCWNDRERIASALDSVLAQDFDANVVVSDNGSSDGSAEFVRERYGDRVTIIENGANLGFAAACNRAFECTSSPYVYLLNPDAQLKPGALREIVAFLDAHPRCGIAGSRIYNLDGSIQRDAVGEFDTWAGAFLRSSAWGELAPFRKYANGASLKDWNYDTPRRVDLVIGAAVAIRRRMLDEIGAFDERFFLYHEEVDLAHRAADAGWETWFVPSSEALHEGRGSSTSWSSSEAYKQRSRRMYWVKHHGRLWYATLAAALIGRYVLFAAAGGAAVLAAQRLLR